MSVTLTRRELCRTGLAGLGAAALVGGRATAWSAVPAPQSTVELRRGYSKTYEDACFTQSVVALVDGAIAAAHIDDYTYVEDSQGWVPVPCSDEGFGEGAVEGAVLVSKRVNNELYTDAMNQLDGACQSWLDSIEAIERFAVGKNPQELYDVDVVSGCTFVSPGVYLTALAQAAQNPYLVTSATFTGTADNLVLGYAEGPGYAGEAFGNAVVLAQDDVAVAADYDAFCYLPFDTPGINAVPCSDAELGRYFAPDTVLLSKAVNDQAYSELMFAQGGAKQAWGDSVAAIQVAAQGFDAPTIDAMSVDTVSGSTLEETDLVASVLAAALAAAQERSS